MNDISQMSGYQYFESKNDVEISLKTVNHEGDKQIKPYLRSLKYKIEQIIRHEDTCKNNNGCLALWLV